MTNILPIVPPKFEWHLGYNYQRINRNTLSAFLRSRSRIVWNSKPDPWLRGNTYDVGSNAYKRMGKPIFIDDVIEWLNK